MVEFDQLFFVLLERRVLVDSGHFVEGFSKTIVDMYIHPCAAFGFDGNGDGLDDKSFLLLRSDGVFDIAVCYLVYLSGRPKTACRHISLFESFKVREVSGVQRLAERCAFGSESGFLAGLLYASCIDSVLLLRREDEPRVHLSQFGRVDHQFVCQGCYRHTAFGRGVGLVTAVEIMGHAEVFALLLKELPAPFGHIQKRHTHLLRYLPHTTDVVFISRWSMVVSR